jgi:hypothetical protein
MVDDEEWKRPKRTSQRLQSLLALARGAWIRKFSSNQNFTGKKNTKTSNKYKTTKSKHCNPSALLLVELSGKD